tara:strand:- start:43 stop:459 length:417 start_codon:yes stop_codon:yes gene_type:complete
MKRFLFLALTAGLLSSCGYSSKYEAKKACEAWSAKSPTYTATWKVARSWYKFDGGETQSLSMGRYLFKDGKLEIGELEEEFENKSQEVGLRGCWPEKETKQFLGMQNQIIRGGAIYTRSEARKIDTGSNMKLVKRFKY